MTRSRQPADPAAGLVLAGYHPLEDGLSGSRRDGIAPERLNGRRRIAAAHCTGPLESHRPDRRLLLAPEQTRRERPLPAPQDAQGLTYFIFAIVKRADRFWVWSVLLPLCHLVQLAKRRYCRPLVVWARADSGRFVRAGMSIGRKNDGRFFVADQPHAEAIAALLDPRRLVRHPSC